MASEESRSTLTERSRRLYFRPGEQRRVTSHDAAAHYRTRGQAYTHLRHHHWYVSPSSKWQTVADRSPSASQASAHTPCLRTSTPSPPCQSTLRASRSSPAATTARCASGRSLGRAHASRRARATEKRPARACSTSSSILLYPSWRAQAQMVSSSCMRRRRHEHRLFIWFVAGGRVDCIGTRALWIIDCSYAAHFI